MPDVEEQLRMALRAHEPRGEVPVTAALSAGRRARRARRAGVALPTGVLAGGVALLASDRPQEYRLVGDGLTVAGGAGVQQVDDDRVDLGGGLRAWRQGDVLSVGRPDRPYAEIDTSSLTSRWGDLGHDVVVFDEPDEHDGTTAVVGTVRGEPTSVRVTIRGVTQDATVACFVQAPGWCSYAAQVPVDWPGREERPQVDVR